MVAAGALLAVLLYGALVGLAAAMVTATVCLLVRSELRRRRHEHDLTEMLAATRTLAREVRSGAAPNAAILAAAAAHQGRSARVLEGLAIAVAGDRGSGVGRRGTGVGSAIRPAATPGGPSDAGNPIDAEGRESTARAASGLVAEITDRLSRGWSLSTRYGVPWASLIEAVSIDLADRVEVLAKRNAQVAGPKVSGYVLAVMPALGLLLGVGMGANPVPVLLTTGAGHLMLLVGCSLTCAGLAWTARIVRG